MHTKGGQHTEAVLRQGWPKTRVEGKELTRDVETPSSHRQPTPEANRQTSDNRHRDIATPIGDHERPAQEIPAKSKPENATNSSEDTLHLDSDQMRRKAKRRRIELAQQQKDRKASAHRLAKHLRNHASKPFHSLTSEPLPPRISNRSIEELGLSTRATNCLLKSEIYTLLDLAEKSQEELLRITNFGQNSVDEVHDVLNQLHLSLPFRAEMIATKHSTTNTDCEVSIGSVADQSEDLRSLALAPRTLNCLYRGGIFYVSELLSKTEEDLLAISHLGPNAIKDITECLSIRGLGLQRHFTREPERDAADEIDNEWQQLKEAAFEQFGSSSLSHQQLQDISRQHASNDTGQELKELLRRMSACITSLLDTLSPRTQQEAESLTCACQQLKDALCCQIFEHSLPDAVRWVDSIAKSITQKNERNWLVYLQRCSGQTLEGIAKELTPPVTRERARQMELKIVRVTGLKTIELAAAVQESLEMKSREAEYQVIREWLDRFDRLPTPGDQMPESAEQHQFWEQVCGMNLKERFELLSKHEREISRPEYDYHYHYVAEQIGPVGLGYWRNFDHVKQFVLRHAITLGQPELMPKQTSFPRAVGGVVTSYGGQSKVAARIGLKYQGQLVGDIGRTYWTEERLHQLLTDTNEFHNLDQELMPSYGQVLDFFSLTDIESYKDKKSPSAIAALTKMGKLHWSEVARRFKKCFVSGESQKAVTLAYIKAFVRDLGEHLDSLTPSELFVLFQAQGINRGEKEKFSRTFDALVDAVQSGMVDRNELRSWAANNEVESIDSLIDLGAELKAESTVEEKEQKLLERRSRQLMEEFPEPEGTTEYSIRDLPTLEPANILRALDKAGDLVDNSATDGDKVEFLKAKATAKLWDACFQDEQALIDKLKVFPAEADSYSQEVQQAFLEEYEGARALPIPPTYGFKDLKGTPRAPKLMQRLVAYRLQRDLRILNLSGTGTGKTLSAIYAAQICNCKRILISCPNGVIDSWRRAFSSAFPSANLIIKPDGWSCEGMDGGVNVVIVNHERFQDRYSQQLLEFCMIYHADMIVIDEIHQSKQRTAKSCNQRRKLMKEFIRISSNINTDLRVLGLSATPVINNLYEGRSLLELIRQEQIKDVDEKVNLNSCMNLYQHFVVHGIRMNPGQLPRTKLIHQEVDATSLLPDIVRATKKGTYHDIEQLLVEPKIACLKHSLVRRSKTVIFLTYIKNTLQPITRWLSANNFSFSVYTGDDKEAQEEGFTDSLDEFIRGKSEVLVATVQCAGTGIDGLQSVCNRAIFFQLPWTSTEFEQAIGRLDRDGTNFDSITVHIPMTDVALPDDQRWSWCRFKLDRIESKRDIAKAAVDGEIPDAATLISPNEASKYWLKWLEKLDQEAAQATTSTS